MTSAAEDIVNFERAVQARELDAREALRRMHNRTHWEPTTEHTPLDSILAAEDDGSDEWAERKQTVSRIFAFFLADGPHPAEVLRRVYALGAHMAIRPFCDFTLREKKLLLGGSHGTHHWLMKKICEDPLRRAGAKAFYAPGQKRFASRKRYSRSQQGNTNRAGKTKTK
jgi:hypothetical protein